MFSWLKRIFGRFSARLTAFFDSGGGQVLTDAVEGALKTAGSAALSLLMQEAKKLVLQAETRDIPGKDKGDDVRNQLMGFAVNLGIQVSLSLVNFALETAVQAMHGETADPVP